MDFDFPEANCTFVFLDGTMLVVQARGKNGPMQAAYVYTTDGKAFALPQSAPDFDEQGGDIFIQQQESCRFFYTSFVHTLVADNGTRKIEPHFSKE